MEEEKYKTLFDKSTVGIVITRLEDSRVVDANPTYQAMLGYTLEELKDLTYQQFTPEKWNDAEAEIIKSMLKTGFGIEDKEYIRKDGTIFPVALRGYIIKDEKGNPEKICAFAMDISERKRAEEALRESEEGFRSLFDGVPIGLYRTTPKGQIVDANQALVQMLGYSDRDSLLGVNVTEIYVNPEDRRHELPLLERKGVKHSELQLRRQDRTIILVQDNARTVQDAAGRMLYYEGSLEDITERKKIEQAVLKELEYRGE